MVPRRGYSKEAWSFTGGNDSEFPGPGCCPDFILGRLSSETVERNASPVSCSLRSKSSRMGRRKLISQRSCCAVLRLGDRNFLCLPTSGLVHVRIHLNNHLLTASFYRSALCNGHSCRWCYRNIHFVAGKSSRYPKTTNELGVAVAARETGAVLLLLFHRDILNGWAIRSDGRDAQGRQVHNPWKALWSAAVTIVSDDPFIHSI